MLEHLLKCNLVCSLLATSHVLVLRRSVARRCCVFRWLDMWPLPRCTLWMLHDVGEKHAGAAAQALQGFEQTFCRGSGKGASPRLGVGPLCQLRFPRHSLCTRRHLAHLVGEKHCRRPGCRQVLQRHKVGSGSLPKDAEFGREALFHCDPAG